MAVVSAQSLAMASLPGVRSQESVGPCRCVLQGRECKHEPSLFGFDVYTKVSCDGEPVDTPNPTPAPTMLLPDECHTQESLSQVMQKETELAQVQAEVAVARAEVRALQAELEKANWRM